jgi:hypothetical protein
LLKTDEWGEVQEDAGRGWAGEAIKKVEMRIIIISTTISHQYPTKNRKTKGRGRPYKRGLMFPFQESIEEDTRLSC